jgi:8-oxo-dGTP pyrophosphatase MutT (NUDIX family)
MLEGAPRPAAVLVPLLRENDEWHILFTRRTESLVEHSGQVAFPGGRMEPEENTPEEAALRETFEEIGLQAGHIHLLGRLDPFVTITNYLITPVVARIDWPVILRVALDEVSRVFTIPLRWLADPANREERLRSLPSPYGSATVIYFQPYDGEVLWGASARITLNLIRILKET